ncbi:MAG: FtsX-like permease family protein [Bdellovibrionota bacterium]
MMFLSLKHLLSRKKQSFLILVGITIGTAAFVAFSGMMLGFQTKLLEQLVNNEAHIRISAREDFLSAETMNSFSDATHVFWSLPPSGRKDSERIEFPVAWFKRLSKMEEVVAYSPQVNVNVLFKKGKVAKAGRFVGSNPEKQVLVTNIEKYITEGSFKKIGNSGNRIIVGKDLLKNLGTRIDETLLISSGAGTPRPFKIVGVFETGVKAVDESTVYGSLNDAQQVRGAPSEITEIAVRLKDPYSAPKIAEKLSLTSLEKVRPWQETSASILSVFKTQDVVRYSVTIAIIIVAGFGIFNILSILVTQKRRDIAILRSIGFLPKDIVKLFFNQGLILGILGGILGLLLGYILCFFIGKIPVEPGRMGSNSGTMVISYDVAIYVKAFAMSLISAVVSSILPAREAASLDPMDIIRTGA